MIEENNQLKRKRNRIEDYDYSQNGAYFITICSKDKAKIFGKIVGADTIRLTSKEGIQNVGEDIILPQIALSPMGKTVDEAICNISDIYENVFVDIYTIMPNHIHIMLSIDRDGRMISAPTISTIVGQFKRKCSKEIGKPIWQKSFYEHVIRNLNDYAAHWQYIIENPLKWQLGEDEYYD
ncbi:MAG: hypothetical protein FWE47_04205 [Oscillospiraceae bacterium]|nr:hypothetical protein [Oscillospiraceae bacterium]